MSHFKISSVNLYIFTLLFIISCSNKKHASALNNEFTPNGNTTNPFYKILPLGDSRVEGATSNSVSYRYDLWKDLVKNEWNFDYIGTQQDNTIYPELMGQHFDPDHEGIGGYKTQDILDNIDDLIEDIGAPDVVLLGIGGNDLVRNISVTTVIDNINQIVDILQNSNTNVTIFIEQIAPGRSNVMTPEALVIYNTFNENISNLASEQTNESSSVIAVDMSAHWTDDYMEDNLHYNHLGAKEVADRYYEAIETTLEK
ncbi:SGNH/GDSL hydrolase family protein [Lacinutrix iliipiscaria]|uniref:SGNH/GDSL hydrolase family protein n=1 Tax=Lacinutrix iliipiscaria TaxID=1230532 RepID=A0ABW5WMX0_9FLAO